MLIIVLLLLLLAAVLGILGTVIKLTIAIVLAVILAAIVLVVVGVMAVRHQARKFVKDMQDTEGGTRIDARGTILENDPLTREDPEKKPGALPPGE